MSRKFEKLPQKVSDFLINGKDLEEKQWTEGVETSLKEFKKRQIDYESILEKIKTTRQEWTLDLEALVLSTWEELHANQEHKKGRPPVWDFVTAWLKKNEVKYVAGSCQYVVKGVIRTPRSLINRLFIDSDRSKFRFSKDELSTPLEILEEDYQQKAMDDLREKIKYTGPNNELRRWVKNITGRDNPVDYQVMKHFVWSVKMRLYHGAHKVEFHNMPVLVGGQGIGKTRAIRQLVKCFGHFVDHDADFDMMGTEVKRFRMVKYLIGFFDELARPDRADMADIKRLMSAVTVGFRELFTQRQSVGPNMMTMIATSNTSVLFSFVDSTGMRRFVEILCREKRKNPYPTSHPDYLKMERDIHAEQQVFWDDMNTIDSAKIFQGVDENDFHPPIKDIMAEVTASQEEMRVLDPVEEFLRDATEPVDVESPEATLISDIHEHYKKFQEMQGTKAIYKRDMLGKKLKSMNLERKHTRKGNVYPLKMVDFYGK